MSNEQGVHYAGLGADPIRRQEVVVTLTTEKMKALEMVAVHWNQTLDEVVSDLLDRALVITISVKVRS